MHPIYFRDAIVMNVFYVLCLLFVLFYGKKLPKKQTNFCFALAITFLYVYFVIAAFRFWKAGKSASWLFYNALPTANVSPFMFFLVSISWFFPRKWKDWLYGMVSILGFGFAVAAELLVIMYCTYLGGVNYIYFNSFDVLAHFVFSLFGIYVIQSRQTNLDFKKFVKSASFLIGYVVFMLVVNIVFHTSFFGLCFTEDYSIYRMKIVSNAYLSAFLYFLGLSTVLLSGYILQKLMKMQKKTSCSV